MTRIDDDLHAQLKAKAKTDGCSVNALVLEVLQALADRPQGAAQRQPETDGFDRP
ncbi:HicB family protein [Amycolatopsis saalfeldensis]|uniref:HicB family protein n=2 Tax=Amycolatopsis saalfeldensis TaxID=394193 RepID=A0A1H8R1W0_9PSEU|nr:HicB family protein [Amycolatopsis saalfeldensis]